MTNLLIAWKISSTTSKVTEPELLESEASEEEVQDSEEVLEVIGAEKDYTDVEFEDLAK